MNIRRIWTGLFVFILLGVCGGMANAQDMALIPAGEFMMGSAEGDEDELPLHKVSLDAFYIDKYEVTNAEYRNFIKAAGHREPYEWENKNFNQDTQPVTGVSWDDAVACCRWRGKRLPTEAEWEKAAGGNKGWVFPWGNDWNRKFANSSSEGKKKTAPVGSYPEGVSPYGVHDMAGNVWEWCADKYGANYYHLSPTHNPIDNSGDDARVIRGGGWFDLPMQLRIANRYYSHPMVRYNGIGFRCARNNPSNRNKFRSY